VPALFPFGLFRRLDGSNDDGENDLGFASALFFFFSDLVQRINIRKKEMAWFVEPLKMQALYTCQ